MPNRIGIKKAIEILNPPKGVQDIDFPLDQVKLAHRMGAAALERTIPECPVPRLIEVYTANNTIIRRRLPHCPLCNSPRYMRDANGENMPCCGNCGKALDWSDYDHVGRMKPK